LGMRRLASCWHAAAGAASAAAPCRGYKSHRVALRKRLGQHLLKNPDVVRNIVRSANVQPHELVLEIGPGTGNMTVPLLEKAKGVFAVELDPDMHLAVTNRVRGLYVCRLPC
jgi:18S rRNA (adenine1779-N6/adenine1780-N6)-dimethyltransferase